MSAFSGRTWPGGIIPYTIDSNFTEISTLNNAINLLEASTNIRFVKRQPTTSDYVVVRNHSRACFSVIGRKGGKQTVGCAPLGFGVGSIVHEFCHAAGVIHEQSRSDRNSFVRILMRNIIRNQRHNFRTVRGSRNRGAYDFQSIMHYSPNAFNNGTTPTIQSISGGPANFGSTGVLTARDIAGINIEYPNLGVVRRSDSARGAGEIGEVAVVKLSGMSSNNLITAVRTGNGELKLIQWQVNSNGGVGRINDTGRAAGTATHIDIAKAPTQNRFVTVCRAGRGNLLLISWNMVGRRIIRQLDSGRAAGAATLNRIVFLTNTIILTACRTSSGKLLLISWRLNADGSFERLRDSGNAAGEVRELSLVQIRNSGTIHQVATTVRTSSGRLRVISWEVSTRDGSINRMGDTRNAIGVGTQIVSTISPNGLLIVSCRTASGTLIVIALSISLDGQTITRLGDSGTQAGRIGRNSLLQRPYGVCSAVSTASGSLLLIKWSISNAGRVTRFGDSGNEAGRIGQIALSDTSQPSAPIVTPLQNGAGDLDIFSWDDLSISGELQR